MMASVNSGGGGGGESSILSRIRKKKAKDKRKKKKAQSPRSLGEGLVRSPEPPPPSMATSTSPQKRSLRKTTLGDIRTSKVSASMRRVLPTDDDDDSVAVSLSMKPGEDQKSDSSEQKGRLVRLINEAKKRVSFEQRRVSEIVDRKLGKMDDELDKSYRVNQATVNDMFDTLESLLAERKRELMSELDGGKSSKQKLLSKDRASFRKYQKTLDGLMSELVFLNEDAHSRDCNAEESINRVIDMVTQTLRTEAEYFYFASEDPESLGRGTLFAHRSSKFAQMRDVMEGDDDAKDEDPLPFGKPGTKGVVSRHRPAMSLDESDKDTSFITDGLISNTLVFVQNCDKSYLRNLVECMGTVDLCLKPAAPQLICTELLSATTVRIQWIHEFAVSERNSDYAKDSDSGVIDRTHSDVLRIMNGGVRFEVDYCRKQKDLTECFIVDDPKKKRPKLMYPWKTLLVPIADAMKFVEYFDSMRSLKHKFTSKEGVIGLGSPTNPMNPGKRTSGTPTVPRMGSAHSSSSDLSDLSAGEEDEDADYSGKVGVFSMVIDGLSFDQKYLIRLRSVNQNGASENSNLAEICTDQIPPPLQPRIRAKIIDKINIQLSWTVASRLLKPEDGKPVSEEESGGGDGSSLGVDHLGSRGILIRSSSTAARPSFSGSLCLPGSGMTKRVSSIYDLRLKWNEMVSVTHYHIQFRKARRKSWRSRVIPVTGPGSDIAGEDGLILTPTEGVHMLEHLTPGTKYEFRVRARNSVDWSQWSKTLSVDIEALGPEQLRMNVVEFRGCQSASFHPENLLRETDASYASKPPVDFESDEADWIVFGTDIYYSTLTRLVVEQYQDPCDVRSMALEVCTDLVKEDWVGVQPNPINLRNNSDRQVFELRPAHSVFRYVRVSFMENFGAAVTSKRKFMLRNIWLYGIPSG